MKVEIHVLQNFAPSNLNRDDTGSPKDCELGGVRRARISSQCLKRSMRDVFEKHALVPAEHLAWRTKRIVEHVAALVAARTGASEERARSAVARAIAGAKLKADEDKDWKTQYLLFLPSRVIEKLAEIVAPHLDALAPDGPPEATSAEPEEGGKKEGAKRKSKRASKAEAKEDVPAELATAVTALLADGTKTPELALFGRMIADAPAWNINAACQVAHAVSTHRVSMEFDFYTAIDDLKKDDTAGSDMMGTIPFNSACFYRYLVVDTAELVRNLGDDKAAWAQARDTVDALIRAAVYAIPSGKQNSMAAQNLPSFIMADVRDGAEPRSLANAFVEPVSLKSSAGDDIVARSIDKLGKHVEALEKVYGKKGRKDLSFVLAHESGTLSEELQKRIGATDRGSLEALIAAVVAAAFGSSA
jgi:CRISPR system Cascade subunit CasC